MDTHFARMQESLRALGDSRLFLAGIALVVALLIALIAFEGGMLFGYHEARSSYQWGENYARNFGGPPEGFIPGGFALPDGHGAFGQIESVTLPTFVLTDPNHPEESVRIDSDTIIRELDKNAQPTALMPGMQVVVLGTPNDSGEIEAKLIRIMPAPPDASSTHS